MRARSGYSNKYHQEMQQKVSAILILTSSSISREQLALFSDLVDANEYGIALDMLTEALASSGTKIDAAAFRDIQSLSEQMKLEPEVVDRLRPIVQ
jgi:chromosome segregation and condensation protein ScpB